MDRRHFDGMVITFRTEKIINNIMVVVVSPDGFLELSAVDNYFSRIALLGPRV